MASLVGDARAAGRGLIGLVRGRPGWADDFSFSTQGFIGSFAGPLAALPLYVLAVALVDRGSATTTLWGAGAAHLVDAFGFPLLLAAIARPLRFEAGYAAFVTVSNWAALYLNAMLAAASLLTLLGADGGRLFGWASLLLLALSVLLVWRIGRETLSREVAPIVLLVVLSIAWSALADDLARRLVGG